MNEEELKMFVEEKISDILERTKLSLVDQKLKDQIVYAMIDARETLGIDIKTDVC